MSCLRLVMILAFAAVALVLVALVSREIDRRGTAAEQPQATAHP